MSEDHPTREKAQPSGRLVQHDITLTRGDDGHGQARVVATVACARRGSCVDVTSCARCAHFARIEPHEAGYLLLCHDLEPGDEQGAERGEE